ncbi:MAG: choice-of-anchor Q domain-containing protein [Solirubrobacterales bacterium]
MRTALLSIVCCGSLLAAAGAHAETIPVDTPVDELNDGTDCSLREAVEAANTNAAVDQCPGGDPGLDTLSLPGGRYVLSLGAAGEDGNQQGDLDVTESLAIKGAGVGACGSNGVSCVDADDLDRALDVRDGADPVSVTLSGLTIEDGNAAADGGGAVRSPEADAGLTLATTRIRSSVAADGGAIASSGAVAIDDSLLAANTATAGGGAISQTGASLVLTGSVVSGNGAGGPAGGAGILAGSGVVVGLQGSTLSANSATSGPGGAIRIQGGSALSASQLTIEDNSAQSGGGIANQASAAIVLSTLGGNQASAACMSGEGNGGAIESRGATSALAILNSTVSENQAGCAGGGVSVADTPSTATITHATITANSAQSGGGGVSNDAGPSGPARSQARGTILGLNSVAGIANNCGGDGTRGSAGFNLETANSCGFSTGAGDLVGTDPRLGPLRFNGGPARTQLPFSDSPAVNAIPSGCPATDQRGIGRPVARRCDIGAVEATVEPMCGGVPVTIAGTSGADTLVGTDGPDVIAGLDGNDVIQGLGDRDRICAGTGNDTVRGGPGRDRLRGEAGRDKLFGGRGRDLLEGGPGKDKLRGGKGKDKQRQ